MTIETAVAGHYAVGRILETILSAARAGADDAPQLRPEDLAPVDEFHIGGRAATAHLVEQMRLNPGQHVLDVGSGIGGTARYLAAEFGCRVTGIDLTPEFCDVANALTHEVGLQDLVDYRQGSATAMPFDDRAFAGAVTLHVGMNIPDKKTLYAEVARVLPPGAPFAIYDVLAGARVHHHVYPVPWAASPETSFLVHPDELIQLLEGAGFRIEAVQDRREFALEFFRGLQRDAEVGPPPLGLHLLMGDTFATKVANMIDNIEERRSAPWEILCRRA